MSTYTNNYAWTKPSGSDQVDVSVLNDNLDSQDSIMHDAFSNMAEPFSELSTYSVGDIVLYGTKTYKCRVPVTTPGSWTGATNWDEYKLSEGGGASGGEVKNLDNGMLSHSTDSSYITVNLDVALTAGKEYKITIRDPYYNYVDTKQIVWVPSAGVTFAGNGGGPYVISLTQTTVSLTSYSGQGWRDIYCDIVSDFETVTAAQTTYDNTTSGLTADNVQGAVDEVKNALDTGVGTLGDKLVTVTADGVKTYSQLFDQLYPYRNRLYRLEIDNTQYYPTSAIRYGHVGGTSNDDLNLRMVVLKETGSIFKSITIVSSTGNVSVSDQSSGVPASGTKIKLVKSFMS